VIYKVLSPTHYSSHNVYDGNIDVNLITGDGDVFFATLFTLSNVQRLMQKEEHSYYFWATDMVIVRDLQVNSIRDAILKIIKDGYLESVFSRIGDIKQIYGAESSFEDIVPPNGGFLLSIEASPVR